jgi:DNA repair protein RecN (Recombination protein N)
LSVDSSAERGGGRAQLESGDLESEEGAERGSEAERGAADNDNDNSDGDGDGDGASSGEPRPALADDLRRFGPNGCEDLEFLLSANPGEPLRPLRHVASGGEAARILLALRGVLARCEPGRALVFDEIDSGVGGRLGPAVGRALRELAAHHQVLCVTHLPAIAALAHAHLRVQKRVERGRTHVGVELLDGEPRVLEIADMIAGGAEQETARAEARRLLEGV